MGSVSTPRSHRLSAVLPPSPLALRHRRLPGSPRSGRAPRSRLRALSLPGPRPPHAGALGFPRADRLPRRPTDARAGSGRRDPAGGRRRRPSSGEGRGGGGEGGRGGDRPRPDAPLALTSASWGAPNPWLGPHLGPRRSPNPVQEARLGVRRLWVACLNPSRPHIPAAQSRAWHPLGAQ